MSTLAQLENQIQELQRRADAMREEESLQAITRIRALMQEYGLTTADLLKAGLGRTRGRPAGSRNTAAPQVLKAKLPPKYRDPVSGATWSGHARAPAWIRNAQDRSAYLIEGAPPKKGAIRSDRSAARTPQKNAQRVTA
jgi:DNA-binding protein H-NS